MAYIIAFGGWIHRGSLSLAGLKMEVIGAYAAGVILLYFRSMLKKLTVACATILGILMYAPSALAADTEASFGEVPQAEETAVTVPAFHTVTPYTASGTTWAPGGALASNSLKVIGKGTYVEKAEVSYQTGTDLGNACVDKFEIVYYNQGRRWTQTAGHHCTPIRVSHTFEFGRRLDNNRPFCGRVQVGGAWSNYACIQIRQ